MWCFSSSYSISSIDQSMRATQNIQIAIHIKESKQASLYDHVLMFTGVFYSLQRFATPDFHYKTSLAIVMLP